MQLRHRPGAGRNSAKSPLQGAGRPSRGPIRYVLIKRLATRYMTATRTNAPSVGETQYTGTATGNRQASLQTEWPRMLYRPSWHCRESCGTRSLVTLPYHTMSIHRLPPRTHIISIDRAELQGAHILTHASTCLCTRLQTSWEPADSCDKSRLNIMFVVLQHIRLKRHQSTTTSR